MRSPLSQYRPARVMLAGALSAWMPVACRSGNLAPAPDPNAQIDVYTQAARAKSDILWVVDSSGSMAREQQQLADSFPKFFDHLQGSQVDYRIAVTTADVFAQAGALVGNPQIIVGNSSDPNFADTADPQAAFAANIHVGTQGSARDEAFEEALLALQQLQLQAAAAVDAGQPVAFLRSDAALFLIFVGDGREYSPPVQQPPSFDLPSVQSYWRQLSQAKGIGNDGLVSISAIAGDTPNGCVPVGCQGDGGADGGATDPGVRYREMTELSGGLFGSICNCSFDKLLDELGLQALALRHKFALTRKPDPATLAVTIDAPCGTLDPENNLLCAPLVVTCPSGIGAACTANCQLTDLACMVPPRDGPDGGNPAGGWSYDPNDQAITLSGLALPPPGSTVTLSYRVVR